jgi:putative PIN family toxin of toxin-antitoxin system
MRVVLDTNAIISALYRGGKPAQVLTLALEGEIQMVVSPFLLNELRRVLQNKFSWTSLRTEQRLTELLAIAQVVTPKAVPGVLVDRDDNQVIACAVTGQAQVIVTGDKDLLRLNTYQGIPIVTPERFLNMFRQSLNP